MKEGLKLALKLFVITAVSALLLAMVNNFTSPIITDREAKEYAESLKESYKDADDFKPYDQAKLAKIKETNPNIDSIAVAQKGGKDVGYVFKLIGKGGYSGDITFVVGVSKEGNKIVGFKVIKTLETPGIGSKILEDSFTNSVIGKKLENKIVKAKEPKGDNEIQAIAGVSYSVGAVLNGLNGAISALQQLEK